MNQKKLYLTGVVILFLAILIMALPQVATTCAWYKPLKVTTNPSLVIMQAAGLGAILGGIAVKYWQSMKKADDEGGGENNEGGKPPLG